MLGLKVSAYDMDFLLLLLFCLINLFVFAFEIGSHAAQAGYKLAM